MALLIDIGNSQIKYCHSDNIKNITKVNLQHEKIDTNWLNHHWLGVEDIVIAAVKKGALLDLINDWGKDNHIKIAFVASSATAFGVISGYQNPTQLGVDRWLVLLAAAKLYPNQSSLIIDAGTATTVDLLTADKQHLGGWILPGIELMFQSLLTNTDLVRGSLTTGELGFADNTSENVTNACWAATIGLIEQAYKQTEKQHLPLDNIILTGGNAAHLSQLLTLPHIVEESLIFVGLAQFLNKKTTNK